MLSSPFLWVRISNPNLKVIQLVADFLFKYLTKLNLDIIIINR